MATRLTNPLPKLSISLLAALCGVLAEAQAAPATPGVQFCVDLKDGSRLMAGATSEQVKFESETLGERQLRWADIRSIECEGGEWAIGFVSGDRLSGTLAAPSLSVQTAIGQVSIPSGQIRRITEITAKADRRDNIALGKKVSGRDGASHGKGLAKHVTDGDYSTHAKPPAFHFDYVVDLRLEDADAFFVDEIKVHWGYFGDRFKGVRRGDGWAPGAWPGEYVKSYRIDYRCAGNDEWFELHKWDGRPVDEDSEGVAVQRRPTQHAGCSSEVTTILSELGLEEVTEIRIRAAGGHWIGLFELEVFGSA